MRLVYYRPGQKAWELVADPTIETPTDAIVGITSSTICGTDLHSSRRRPSQTDGLGLLRVEIATGRE